MGSKSSSFIHVREKKPIARFHVREKMYFLPAEHSILLPPAVPVIGSIAPLVVPATKPNQLDESINQLSIMSDH